MSKVVVVVLLAIVIIIPFVVNYGVSLYRAELATNRIHAAWHVLDPQTALTRNVYDTNDIPIALKTRKEVAVYFFLEAARLDARASAAYYNLGKYFLDKDCELARQYFEKHAELIGEEDDTQRILQAIETGGCEAGVAALPQ